MTDQLVIIARDKDGNAASFLEGKWLAIEPSGSAAVDAGFVPVEFKRISIEFPDGSGFIWVPSTPEAASAPQPLGAVNPNTIILENYIVPI